MKPFHTFLLVAVMLTAGVFLIEDKKSQDVVADFSDYGYFDASVVPHIALLNDYIPGENPETVKPYAEAIVKPTLDGFVTVALKPPIYR